MILRLPSSLFGLLIASVSSFANSQVPSDVRSKLSTESVVLDQRYVYATGIAKLRGTSETDEQRAVMDALRLIVNKLCRHEPRPHRRLEAAVTGASLLESSRVERKVEVVVRVPLQSPTCKVVEIARSPERLGQESDKKHEVSDKKTELTPQTKLLDSSYQRTDGITTRVLGGEY